MTRSQLIAAFTLVLAALASFLPAAPAMAQRDAGAKIRGEFGGRSFAGGRSAARRSYGAYYRAPAATIVRRAPIYVRPAPVRTESPAVAQAPAQRRSFSYEPGTRAAPAPQYRSYSYEPAPVYRAPATSRRSSALGPQRSYERADSKLLGRVGR
jgi:hypothetical protein